MYIVIEKRMEGGHSRSQVTNVYEFDDQEKLKKFLIGRDTSRCNVYHAEKMKFDIELKLEKEEGVQHGDYITR